VGHKHVARRRRVSLRCAQRTTDCVSRAHHAGSRVTARVRNGSGCRFSHSWRCERLIRRTNADVCRSARRGDPGIAMVRGRGMRRMIGPRGADRGAQAGGAGGGGSSSDSWVTVIAADIGPPSFGLRRNRIVGAWRRGCRGGVAPRRTVCTRSYARLCPCSTRWPLVCVSVHPHSWATGNRPAPRTRSGQCAPWRCLATVGFDEKQGPPDGVFACAPRACFGGIQGHPPPQVSAQSRCAETKSGAHSPILSLGAFGAPGRGSVREDRRRRGGRESAPNWQAARSLKLRCREAAGAVGTVRGRAPSECS
jgi:hypothetical protein